MRNPYIVGNPVYGPHSYGRQSLVQDLLDERRRCVYLVGNRRVGKTSLLRRLEDQATCVTVFLNLQATGGEPVRMGRTLVRQVKRKANKTPILHQVRFDADGDVCDAATALSEAAEDEGFQVLLLWDEAEVLLRLSDGCLERLRGSLHDKAALRVVLAATERLSELRDRCRGWPTSPFLDGFETRYIPPLSDADAQQLICQANNPQGQVEASSDTVAKITHLAGGHPYLIQLLCDRLYRPEGRLDPVPEREPIVDNVLANVFQIDYNALSPSERAILRQLSGPDAIGASALQQALDIQQDRLHRHLMGLEQLGYLQYHDKDDQYRLANSFLRAWLRMGPVVETPFEVSDTASLETADAAPNPWSDRSPAEGASPTSPHDQPVALRKTLVERFTREQLRTLCADMGIDHEDFPEAKEGLARELVTYCERRNRVDDLAKLVEQR